MPPIAGILTYTILSDKAATLRERWLTPWQACAPDPEGTPVAARIGASRPSTFMSHARCEPNPARSFASVPGLPSPGVDRIEGMRISSIALLALLSYPLHAQSPVKLKVDATDATRRLFHVQMSMPAKPGPMTLLYP